MRLEDLKERTELLIVDTTNDTIKIFMNNPNSRIKEILSFFDIWSYNGGGYYNERIWSCELSKEMKTILLSKEFINKFDRVGIEIIT